MKVSVCLATYNGAKYIETQVASILPQLKIDDELIISDDGSSDDTLMILKELNDSRIKIFENQFEKGFSNNFEHAINKATGDIIFICDQDDYWEPNKVAIISEMLTKYDIVISDAQICDDNLNPTLGSHFEYHKIKKGFFRSWLRMRYIGACMAFNRKVLEKILPFPKNKDYSPYDYWIAVASEMYYKVGLAPQMLTKYRRHSNTATTGGIKSTNTVMKRVAIRFYALKYLVARLLK